MQVVGTVARNIGRGIQQGELGRNRVDAVARDDVAAERDARHRFWIVNYHRLPRGIDQIRKVAMELFGESKGPDMGTGTVFLFALVRHLEEQLVESVKQFWQDDGPVDLRCPGDVLEVWPPCP